MANDTEINEPTLNPVEPEKPKGHNLKLNTIFNAIYQVLALIVPFITSPYISRVLLPEGVGSYSYAYAIVTYFVTISTWGFLEYGTVTMAKHRDNKEEYSKLFWEICVCKFIISMVVTLLYVALVFTSVFQSDGYPLNSKLVYLIMGLDIIVAAIDVTFMFQGLENFISLCIRNIIIKVLNLVCIFVFVKTSNDYIPYVLIISLGLFLSGFSTILAIPRHIARPHFHKFNLFKHFIDSFVYFIPYLASTVFFVIPKTFLGLLKADSSASGYYESADKLINIILNLIGSINAIMMSRMTYLYEKKDEQEIKRKTAQIFNIYFLVTVPAFFGLLAINKYFTIGFFGEDYEQSIMIVYILAFKILTNPIYQNLGSIYYVPAGHPRQRAFLLLAGTGINIVLSILLTYFYGIKGTAIASLMSDVITAILFLAFAKIKVKSKALTDSALKCFCAGLLMVIALFFANKFIANHFYNRILISVLLILVGMIVYGCALLLFREEMTIYYTKHILSKIKRIFHRG